MRSVIIASVALAAIACNKNPDTNAERQEKVEEKTELAKERAEEKTELAKERAEERAEKAEDKAEVQQASADNTKKNERDRNTETLTPGDQGESEADRTITQQIRQGVVKHDDLSLNAKNVKIITVNGVVTLRGPVKSAAEKTAIATLAQRATGVKRVDNQLEVEAK